MLLFLYGADTYRSRQKLQEIVARYKKIHPRGLNLQYFDLADGQFNEFQQDFARQPLFKEKKLFIVSQPLSSSDFCRKFLEEKEKFLKSEDVIVFYEKGEAPKNNKFFAFLQKQGKTQEFKLLSGLALRAWAEKEASKLGLAFESAALNRLIGFVGQDLWRLQNELKKLSAYRPSASVIKTEDIELLVRPTVETDIFRTIEALAAKNKSTALALLKKHLTKGDSPLYLLSMIHYQFRNLLLIKDLLARNASYTKLAQISRLHPFVLKKSIPLAAEFTLAELKKIYQRIFETDLAIKTGRIDAELALDLLVAEI